MSVGDENTISKNSASFIAQETQQCTEHPTQIRGLRSRTSKAIIAAQNFPYPFVKSQLNAIAAKTALTT